MATTRKKRKSACLHKAKNNLERHSVGFQGEHVAKDYIENVLGHKNVSLARHKYTVDVNSVAPDGKRFSWEVKTCSSGAEDKFKITDVQRKKKDAFCKRFKREKRTLGIKLYPSGKAELHIQNHFKANRINSENMKKVYTYEKWKKSTKWSPTEYIIPPKGPGKITYVLATDVPKAGAYSKYTLDEFVKLREKYTPKDKLDFITHHTVENLKKKKARVYISADGKSGYAISKQGELLNLFSANGSKHGKYAMYEAVRNGARYLDCYDGFLPGYYNQFHFLESAREAWNPRYAPKHWNYKKYGKPDVVYMELGKGAEDWANVKWGTKYKAPQLTRYYTPSKGYTIRAAEIPEELLKIKPHKQAAMVLPDNFEDITNAMKRQQATWADISTDMEKELSRIRTQTVHLRAVDGDLTEDTAKLIRSNMKHELGAYTRYLAGDTTNLMRDFIDDTYDLLRDNLEAFKGINAAHIDAMCNDWIKKMTYQEIGSNRLQFTDHGIRHLANNVLRQNNFLDILQAQGMNVTAKDRLMGRFVMVNHDIGYSTPLVRMGGVRGVMAAGDHPWYSTRITYQQKDLWDIGKIFTAEEYTKSLRLIRTHDWTRISQVDALTNATRLSDNLALFYNEKLPSMFKYVEGATPRLINMGSAAARGDTEMFEKLRKSLYRTIDQNEVLGANLKRDLKAAVKELDFMTPKYSMGVLAGEMKSVKAGTNAMLSIEVEYNKFDSLLQKMFDMGQYQTHKFLRDYGITDFTKDTYYVGKVGDKYLLELKVLNAPTDIVMRADAIGDVRRPVKEVVEDYKKLRYGVTPRYGKAMKEVPEELRKYHVAEEMEAYKQISNNKTKYPVISDVVDDFDKKFMLENREHAMAINPETGETLLSKRGGKHSVSYTLDEFKSTRGASHWHNHPFHQDYIGGSFSKEDILAAIDGGYVEIGVIDQKYIYVGWVDENLRLAAMNNDPIVYRLLDEYDIAYDRIKKRVVANLRELLNKKVITKAYINEHWCHIINREIAKEIPWYHYVRVPHNLNPRHVKNMGGTKIPFWPHTSEELKALK